MSGPEFEFPEYKDIFSSYAEHDVIKTYLDKYLFDVAKEFTDRSSKCFRAQLVDLGCQFAGGDSSSSVVQKNLDICKQTIEFLHSGSLIIDDIQDKSPQRRGEPAIHMIHGLSKAINCGNWMYFRSLRLLDSLDLPEERKQAMIRFFVKSVEQAHFGQTMDISISIETIEQNDVASICEYVARNKTGVITGLAVYLGSACMEVDEHKMRSNYDFGMNFGKALQMFDDIGNASEATELSKRWEDLIQLTPSWLWSCASEYSVQDYQDFVQAVEMLPENTAIVEWMASRNFLAVSAEKAKVFLSQVVSKAIENSQSEKEIKLIKNLSLKLEQAYV